MRKILTVFFLLTLYVPKASAQDEPNLLGYGLRAGMNFSSKITNLETTIMSEPYFINYTLTSMPRKGYAAGGYINYRFMETMLAIEANLMYSQQGSDLLFNNIEKDFNYKIQFDYQYINVGTLFKLYPLKLKGHFDGLNIAAGPQFGFNVASQNIIYTSGGTGRLDAFGSDIEQQQQLRNVLKGKNNFGFNLGLGYDFRNFGLTVDGRWFAGMNDQVETLPNSYNFIENKNTNSHFQVTIGWDFSFFNSGN